MVLTAVVADISTVVGHTARTRLDLSIPIREM